MSRRSPTTRESPGTTSSFPSRRSYTVCLNSGSMKITRLSLKAGLSTQSVSAKTWVAIRILIATMGDWKYEMWRAIRLGVDSGGHEKHRSPDQKVAYFHRYTAID